MSPPVDDLVIPRGPIIYKLPDPNMKPDVRITVFDQVFHVHSTILRIYSAFFRKFLDSPDKITAPTSAPFRYEYVSVVDDDGTWGLEAVGNSGDVISIPERGNDITGNSKDTQDTSTSVHPLTPHSKIGQKFVHRTRETNAFLKLMSALYRKSYHVGSINDLKDIVRLADFYCALLAVEASLDSVLLNSPDLIEMIPQNSIAFLGIAYKLYHRILFGEALVHVVAGWEEGSGILDNDPELAQVVITAYNRLHLQIHKVTFDILRARNEDGVLREAFEKAARSLKPASTAGTALFFRTIYNSYPWPPPSHRRDVLKAQQALELLLSSKLDLAKLVPNSVPIQAGVGNYESKFLCVSIGKHELPWDTTAVDW